MNTYILLYILSFNYVARCTKYIIDDMKIERRFDGIGAISGGGATSKLLVNYPKKQRDEILDYLFKPNFGASLQIFKVEIGGDAQSTDGTEASHMHEPWDENYHRGYEWWMMKEAKQRNPSIKLYGLPWAFPGWLGHSKTSAENGRDPYANPELTADYVTRWVAGAKRVHDLDIDYIGIWNERKFNSTYIKVLRTTLNKAGFGGVAIVASDGDWSIADATLRDQQLANSYDVIGVHYPGTTSTASALNTSKTLWSSEDYSTFDDDKGAGCLARIVNQNYVNGQMTSTIFWNVIASYYRDLPFGDDGLMTAREPWSGYYTVNPPIWATAHTTQFTDIGWSYLKANGHLTSGGSYVTLIDPTKQHITIVIETMSHDHSQCIRPYLPPYKVANNQTATFEFSSNSMLHITSLHLWRSKLRFDSSPSTLFESLPPVQLTGDRRITLTLDIDSLYTLTSVDTGRKGRVSSSPPGSKPFPLPYIDTFEDYPANSEAFNFVPQVGVFEVIADDDDNMVNSQMVLQEPIDWCRNVIPVTLGSDYNRSDVTISLMAKIPGINGTQSVFVASRIDRAGCDSDKARGVYLTVTPSRGRFSLTLDSRGKIEILNGVLARKIELDMWFSIVLRVYKDKVSISVDLQDLVVDLKLPNDVSPRGFVGYGTASFARASFDYLYITD